MPFYIHEHVAKCKGRSESAMYKPPLAHSNLNQSFKALTSTSLMQNPPPEPGTWEEPPRDRPLPGVGKGSGSAGDMRGGATAAVVGAGSPGRLA